MKVGITVSGLRVGLDELIPSKTIQRELPRVLSRIEGGEVEHIIITKRGAARGVLISIDRYLELLNEDS